MTEPDPFADITASNPTMSFTEAFADLEFLKLALPDIAQGQPSIDFDLPLYDFSTGKGAQTGERFCLSTVTTNQPVALIFGSYT